MKILDLENSYVYFKTKADNCWRSSIKASLTNLSDNKKFYLTKECKAELVGPHPFKHLSKSELVPIIEDKKLKYLIRDIPVFKNNDFDNHHYNISPLENQQDEVILNETEYKLIEYDDILKHLKNRSLENLYCKLDYTFQNKKYCIFSKVEYLNFPGSSFNNKKLNKDYLQPIMGYIPFEKDGKIYISYVARYISSKLEGNLEFRLRANTKLSNFYYAYGFKENLKKYILKLLDSFIKVSEFYKRISINQSDCSFYIKK